MPYNRKICLFNRSSTIKIWPMYSVKPLKFNEIYLKKLNLNFYKKQKLSPELN